MAVSLFKRVASAFVETEGEPPQPPATVVDEMDAILAKAPPPVASAPVTQAVTQPKGALDYTLDQVYASAKVQTGPNSADRIVTLIAKLGAIPENQRLVAVRAMDAADDSWAESDVLADAKLRIRALAQFSALVDKDVQTRQTQIGGEFASLKTELEGEVADIDRQIAALQAQRAETLARVDKAQQHTRESEAKVQAQGDQVKAAITSETEKYQKLITFFEVTPA